MSKLKITNKLTFEPTIFRDWSMVTVNIAWQMFTKEFKKQFNWQYTDALCVWDGKKVTFYMAREEYIYGLFNFLIRKIKKDKNFIEKICKSLLSQMSKYTLFTNKILETNFDNLRDQSLLNLFNLFVNKNIALGPKFLITRYFPQNLERYPELLKKYKKQYNLTIRTREKIDRILAPISEKIIFKFTKYFLKKIGAPISLARFSTIEEVNMLATPNDKKLVKKIISELKRRKKYFLFAGGKISYIAPSSYLKNKNWKLVKNQNKDEIKGYVAYRGKKNLIRGVVRVIENKTEFSKLKKNEIIVAPMTNPEYAVIIKKTKAIITNEGGVTCHAAIISRELKIPCIIGAKNATQILRDNDLIEMDINKGMVKKL